MKLLHGSESISILDDRFRRTLKISIITAVYNGSKTIADCIKSVACQSYPAIEHIIVDGGSTDLTLDVIKKCSANAAKVISEPDNGMYDAMNKGLRLATGEIVGILNSDDVYADEFAVASVVKTLRENNTDSCYADLVYVDRINTDRVVRHWKSGSFHRERFEKGWMPPHPTFFVKREVYEKYGLLNTDFPLAADYELMLRLLYKYQISTTYIPRVMVRMRAGGTSNPGMYTVKALWENYQAWKVNELSPKLMTFVLKCLSKIGQFSRKTE